MRKKRIVIYGGTDLPPNTVRLVHHLVQAILEYPDMVIVTGGIIKYRDEHQGMPTDQAARVAAEEVLDVWSDRIEFWVPDPQEDDREYLIREKGPRTRTFTGSTAEGRRFALVLETDAIITFKGKTHTGTVLELALRENKPVLPIPFTGGDSQRYWAKHKTELQRRFKDAGELFNCLEEKPLDSLDEPNMKVLAKLIAEKLALALERRCLVLMPFGEWGAEAFFEYVVKPKIEASFGFSLDRLDRSSHAGHIPQAFLQHVERAEAVVADITDTNPNVMYEIGHVHGRNKAPFLFWRRERKQPPPELPFYFKPETFRLVDPASKEDCVGFGDAVGKYLREVVKSGIPRWPSEEKAGKLQ